jgi:hypothetical protein
MAVAEKYRVRRTLKFNGRAYEAGDAIDRAAIISVDPSKLGSLTRTGFIELDPVARPLDKMTKADLIDYGREIGAAVDQAMVKADLIAAIESEL